MTNRMILLLAAAALLIAACTGCGGAIGNGGANGNGGAISDGADPAEGNAGAITVQEPWARAAKAGGNSAVYFAIENGGEADTLLDAKCDAAMMVQVHMTQTDAAGNSSMIHQESVPVPASDTVTFEPGGLHVMLMNLKTDLQPGEVLPVTLRFEKAGEVQVQAAVMEP